MLTASGLCSTASGRISALACSFRLLVASASLATVAERHHRPLPSLPSRCEIWCLHSRKISTARTSILASSSASPRTEQSPSSPSSSSSSPSPLSSPAFPWLEIPFVATAPPPLSPTSNREYLYGFHSIHSVLAKLSSSSSSPPPSDTSIFSAVPPRSIYSLYLQPPSMKSSQELKLTQDDQRRAFLAQTTMQLTKNRVRVSFLPRKEMDKLSENRPHNGILIQASKYDSPSISSLLPLLSFSSPPYSSSLILLLDSLQDPHNIGAILRSAFLFGVRLVVLSRCAVLSPTVLKSSAGAMEFLTVVECNRVRDALSELRTEGRKKDVEVEIVGLTAKYSEENEEDDDRGDIQTIEQKLCDIRCIEFPAIDKNIKRVTILIAGSEDRGIRLSLRRECTKLAFIPQATDEFFDKKSAENPISTVSDKSPKVKEMDRWRSMEAADVIESLNVSNAVAVALHQIQYGEKMQDELLRRKHQILG